MGIRAAWQALWGESKESPVVAFSSVGQPTQMPDRFEAFAREGYQQNIVVYRCVRLISEAAAAVPLKLFRGEQEIDDSPLLDLLDRPSPMHSGVELFSAWYAYWQLAGETYIHGVGPDQGPPRELYPLRPDRMFVIPSGRLIPSAYEYRVEGVTVDRFDVDQMTGDAEVKQSKMWNPLDDHHGMSPLKAASLGVDQHNATGKHNLALLQNGGRPSGFVVFKPTDDRGNMTQLTADQREDIHRDIRKRYEGPENAGRIGLLEGDFKWEQAGLTPKDMDWSDLKKMSATDIAMAYGVPPQLVGVEGSLTFANYEQARLAFYEETVVPLLMRGQAELNEWLAPKFGEGLELRYDLNGIEALAERRFMRVERVTEAVKNGVMSIAEARSEIGLDEKDGTDVLLIPSTMIPLNADDAEDEQRHDPDTVVSLARTAYGKDVA